jgi:hypothetical protein
MTSQNTEAKMDRRFSLPSVHVYLGPVIISLLLWFASPNDISVLQSLAAFALLLMASWSYSNWQKASSPGLPLFAGVTAMYWLFFALQLYLGDRRAIDWRMRYRAVSDAAITESMLLVVAGMIGLWFGIQSGIGRRLRPARLPELRSDTLSTRYLQGLLLLSTWMGRSALSQTLLGAEFRQVVSIFEQLVCLAALVILLQRIREGNSTPFDRWFAGATVVGRILIGVSSGWVGSAISLGLVCAGMYVMSRRKLPLIALAVVVPYVLFFQAGKNQFRHTFWYLQTEADITERLSFWVDASAQRWQAAFDDPSGSELKSLLSDCLSRASLLTQAANVVQQTPDPIPYQYGRTYEYLVVGWVPRFLWPDKPSVNAANQFYQVAYGLTAERDLWRVSIAAGLLTEAYINFGWLGVVGILFLIGVFLDFWNRTFLWDSSKVLALGIGVAMLPQLLSIEAQLATYLGGTLQEIAVLLLAFAPVVRWRRKAQPSRMESGSLAVTAVKA